MATKNKTKKTVNRTSLTKKVGNRSLVLNKKLLPFLKSGLAKKLVIILLVGIASFLLAKKYRSQFIVATVNYQPISRFQLNQLLGERYGQVVLDELVNQTLIKDLMKENKVTVTTEDVEEEIGNLKEQLGGDQAFEAAIAQYGLTLDQLKERLEITLGQRKLSRSLFSPEVTENEVLEYYSQNQSMFGSTSFPDVKEDIKLNLLDQKLQQEFNVWFEEQREKASIRLFI
jgi:parvulin-like peptidyl-prolyl isomerase